MRLLGLRMTDGVLLLAAIGLVLTVYLTGDRPTTGELEARATHLLPVFRQDEISALERRGEDPLVLVRQSGRWLLRGPVEAVADDAEVDDFLRTLRYATWIRRLPKQSVDVEASGLQSPQWIWRVEMGQFSYELALGGPTKSPAEARYVASNSDVDQASGTFVISETLAEGLSKPAAAFRVRRLVSLSESEIGSITIEGQDEHRLSLRQAHRNDWRFSERFGGARISRPVIDRLLLQLSRTQASDFIEYGDARAIQTDTKPLVTATFVPSQSGALPIELRFGGTCPRDEQRIIALRVQPEPLAACVPAGILGALLERPDAFLDRHLFSFRLDEVEEVVVEQGALRLELARKGDTFRMRAPKERDLASEAVTQRVSSMLEAHGVATEHELDAPFVAERVITLRGGALDEADIPEEIVELGPVRADGTQLARRRQDGLVLVISDDAARAFVVDDSLLRPLQVLDIPKEQLLRVSVRSDSGAQVVQRRGDADFVLEEPAGYLADATLCGELFDRLRSLRAETWVRSEPEVAFGLEKPSHWVTLLTVSGQHQLSIGRRAAIGGYFASLDGDGVFALSTAVVAQLKTWLISREGFAFEPSQVDAVRVQARGRRFSFERLGESFVQTDGPRLETRRIDEMLDALSVIRPLAAIDLGPGEPRHGFSNPVLAVTLKAQVSAGAATESSWRIGASDYHDDFNISYGRLDDVSAVFAIPRSSVERALRSLE